MTAISMAAALFLLVGVSACSSDEEENPTHPEGPVSDCFGDCPFGECGNLGTDCSSVYAEPVDSMSTYCPAGSSGEYCLAIDERAGRDYWAVFCENGEASFEHCGDGCGWSSGGGASCD